MPTLPMTQDTTYSYYLEGRRQMDTVLAHRTYSMSVCGITITLNAYIDLNGRREAAYPETRLPHITYMNGCWGTPSTTFFF